ncbi:MAG: SCO family protein [Bradyrhizobium sp.]
MKRSFIPLLGLVLLIGIGALARATEGFRVITSEGARQLSVARHPRPVPDVSLIDQDGHPFSLTNYRGRTLLIDFIYTRCPTLCGVLGNDFHRVLAAAPNKKFDLLSVSFDPANDDREALRFYGDRFGAAAPRWRIAVTADKRGLDALLRTFGVVVLPDGIGGFVHDGVIYVVNRDGRFANIIEPDASAQMIEAAMRPAKP